jgi:hypothetical protein
LHAEITIRHRSGDIVAALAAEFGEHDPDALARSLLLADEFWQERIAYATETPAFRLLCYPTSTIELQLWVEPITGNLRSACQTVWDGVRHGASNLEPSLEELTILDEATGQVVLRGETGVRANLVRRELVLALAGGVVAAALLVAGWWTFASESRAEAVVATVPAIIVGSIALFWLVMDVRRGRLRWGE